MRGSLRKAETKRGLRKGESAWRIIITTGRRPNGKPKQKWSTFYGTRQQAERHLTELIGSVNRGEFVEPTKLTFGEWLEEWLAKAIAPPRRCRSTHTVWSGILRNHLIPALGHFPIQRLTHLHLEQYYAALTPKVAPATAAAHHTIITSALKAAVQVGYLRQNVAQRTTNKPRRRFGHEDTLRNVWTVEQARKFLAHLALHATLQERLFFNLAIDSGMRRGELLGLQWKDIAGTKVRVERQLARGALLTAPEFELPKGKRARTIEVSDATAALLAEHRRAQAALKLANRTTYRDHGLVFALEHLNWGAKRAVMGSALHPSGIRYQMERLCRDAEVPLISPHGLRHTCATLLLSAAVPPHVVQRRLGHSDVAMTLGVYSHVLPSQQADAAEKLGSLLQL